MPKAPREVESIVSVPRRVWIPEPRRLISVHEGPFATYAPCLNSCQSRDSFVMISTNHWSGS